MPFDKLNALGHNCHLTQTSDGRVLVQSRATGAMMQDGAYSGRGPLQVVRALGQRDVVLVQRFAEEPEIDPWLGAVEAFVLELRNDVVYVDPTYTDVSDVRRLYQTTFDTTYATHGASPIKVSTVNTDATAEWTRVALIVVEHVEGTTITRIKAGTYRMTLEISRRTQEYIGGVFQTPTDAYDRTLTWDVTQPSTSTPTEPTWVLSGGVLDMGSPGMAVTDTWEHIVPSPADWIFNIEQPDTPSVGDTTFIREYASRIQIEKIA